MERTEANLECKVRILCLYIYCSTIISINFIVVVFQSICCSSFPPPAKLFYVLVLQLKVKKLATR